MCCILLSYSNNMQQSPKVWSARSEEHTSELQSRPHLVCRLLLEKKNASGAGCNRPSLVRGALRCVLPADLPVRVAAAADRCAAGSALRAHIVCKDGL